MTLQFSNAWAVTVSVRVNSSNDDAEELISDGSMYRNSSDLELSYDDFPVAFRSLVRVSQV